MGTISALLALRHSIVSTCSPTSRGGRGAPLHVCFVDFRKAFDSVVRNRIWKRLHDLGIRGRMLTAVMDLYSNTKMQVRVNGKTSRGFIISTMGVKQGCPVSPLLFGLFIEQLHEHLASSCPHIGVSIVGDDKLKEMLYADDVTLLSYTPCELQQLCNSLHKNGGTPIGVD